MLQIFVLSRPPTQLQTLRSAVLQLLSFTTGRKKLLTSINVIIQGKFVIKISSFMFFHRYLIQCFGQLSDPYGYW